MQEENKNNKKTQLTKSAADSHALNKKHHIKRYITLRSITLSARKMKQ